MLRRMADFWQFRGQETMCAVVRAITIAAGLITLPGMAGAAEIRVLSVGAVRLAVRGLAADFTKESGHQIAFTIGSPAVVMEKIKAGEIYDVLIASEPAMDQLDGEGIVNPESRVRLARTGLGVAVRSGAPVPDLSTAEAFAQALTNAKSIVYGDPALPNQSGEKAEKVLAKAGLLETLRGKIRIVPGQQASQEMIAKGEVELGLYNVSEIPEGKGLSFAGPVPGPLQINTTYEGALMSDGSEPQAATAFIRYLAEPGAHPKWTAARLEPVADRQ
jgi:molybdate transport system substrate-binding protein